MFTVRHENRLPVCPATTAAGLAAASVGAPEHNTRLCFLTGAVDARGALDELLRFRNDGLTICATD